MLRCLSFWNVRRSFSARFTAEYQYRILPTFQSSQLRRSIRIVNHMWCVLSLFMKKFRKRRIYIYFNASFLFVNKWEALAGNIVDAKKTKFSGGHEDLFTYATIFSLVRKTFSHKRTRSLSFGIGSVFYKHSPIYLNLGISVCFNRSKFR